MRNAALARKFDDRDRASDAKDTRPAVTDFPSRYAQLNAIRAGLQARQLRGQFFNAKLFADPAWDMLLELQAATILERRLTVSRLTERSGVPGTTALRWIATLEREGLIQREEDRLDGRRYYLSLSQKGVDAMNAYFEKLLPAPELL